MNLYVNRLKYLIDNDGFISGCDGLLFTALAGTIPGISLDITKFRDSSGQWFRKPISEPECLSCGESKSTISRDMLLGVLFYALHHKRRDIIDQVINYALKHFGIMGKAEDLKTTIGRCLMTPGLLSTFAWASYHLGGSSRAYLRYLPCLIPTNLKGYQAHLAVLHAHMRQYCGAGDYSKVIKAYSDKAPYNALFQVLAGNKNEARIILNDLKLFPTNKVPTTKNYKTHYLWQRDFGKDYQPDPGPEKQHDCLDWLLVHYLLNDEILKKK